MKTIRSKLTIDIELLREILAYDSGTGALTWRKRDTRLFAADKDVDPWNERYAGSQAFVSADSRGYLRGKIQGKRYAAHRVIWAMVHGVWPDEVDHINGVRSDNRLANLRDVSTVENGQNRKRPNTNTSGVVGVVWHKQKQRWQAQIGVNNRMVSLGRFADFDAAVAARKAAEINHGYHENHGREVAA